MPEAYDRAEGDLNRSLQLAEDWVPAWISLADLAVRRHQYQAATSYLDSAEKSIRTMEDREKRRPLTGKFSSARAVCAP